MKKHKWMGLIAISILVSTQGLYAQESVISPIIGEDYIDTRSYNLPYKSIQGFLVAPLQIPGELLAPFNEERQSYEHEGIDIRATEGTPVFAIADGIITKAAPDSKGVENGGGKMIFLDCGNGVEGRYMHLSAYGVKAGDYVKAGQVIGFSGNTGDSSTPHLHFEYRVNDVPINPAFIFEVNEMILSKDDAQTTNTVESFQDNESVSFLAVQE